MTRMGDIMRQPIILAVICLILLAIVPASSEARVVRFVLEQTRRVADGKSFGDAGSYERLDGTVYIEVDPRDPLNAGIVNLDKAPRTLKGMVGFSSPFFILKPVDMARGNHKLLYGVNNRGNKLDFAWRTILPQTGTNNNNPLTAADFGDGFLLRLGYTYVDAGWQGNVAAGNDRLVPSLPVAVQPDGRPIVARIRVEYADAEGFTHPLEGSPAFRAYDTNDMDAAHSTLTVRDTIGGVRTPIPADRWAFGRCQTGQASLVPTTVDICLFDGFKPDRIYELIYPAKNPMVMGLGYVVTRDVGSFLRYQAGDDAGNANPLALNRDNVGIRRAYGSGISSTGMYMRDWLYLGFNEDEAHRKVFDAVQIIIPGTHRLLANVEFGDPNTYSREDVWHDWLSYSYPPLTFAVTTDPISGIRDGILKRPATDPLVLQIDSANEFWQMNASLNVHDAQGRPVPVPDNVRLYFASSFQHGGVAGLLSPPRPAGMCQNQTQGNGWPPTLRALLMDLDEWADRGIEPPRSNYPLLEDKTLVSLDAARAAFPAIPGVKFPGAINDLSLPNFGSDFEPKGGRLAQLPPTFGGRYQLFVPRPDSDGLDVAGIRPVEVAAPTSTLMGWNVRAPGHRETDLCGLSGSVIPFAKTRAARQERGDPRPSLEERYGNQAGFVKAVQEATRKLVTERFLLQEDAARYIQAASGSAVLSAIP
jgi:Alpha/beta hydrolase domain